MRQLLLLRHGKSDWSQNREDFERPLKDRGKRDAQRIGVWLDRKGRIPDCIISSPAERAIVTAEKCCKSMGLGVTAIVREMSLYHAAVDELLNTIQQLPDHCQRVLLVSHNPGLENLLLQLAAPLLMSRNGEKRFPTAALALLEFDIPSWSALPQNRASRAEVLYPRTLPATFPWPQYEPQEQRKRPAYYYQQSSVIPYRIHNGVLEILLIRSSKRKHWVIPKGIQEPGLTPQQSAAKEAREEAGVEGVVDNRPISHYHYRKWGAECRVELYPMAVERLIDAPEWEESHRGRRWVTPEEAASMVQQPALKLLLQTFSPPL